MILLLEKEKSFASRGNEKKKSEGFCRMDRVVAYGVYVALLLDTI